MPPYLELRWEGDGTSYDIYRDDVFVANSQQPYYIDYNVINGETYTYYVKSFNGDCESEFSNPISMIYVGLDDIKTDNITTKLYPNPSDGKAKLNVEGLNTEADVLVYDMVGRIVQRHSLNKGKNHLEIDLSGYAKGVYSVRIVNESVNQTLKLIVR